ncbi:unnamed protein product, partial [Didymodactylos carnosus]
TSIMDSELTKAFFTHSVVAAAIKFNTKNFPSNLYPSHTLTQTTQQEQQVMMVNESKDEELNFFNALALLLNKKEDCTALWLDKEENTLFIGRNESPDDGDAQYINNFMTLLQVYAAANASAEEKFIQCNTGKVLRS